MVNVSVPVGVFLFVATVRVEVPEPLTDVGLNVPLARRGSPLMLKLTLPVNPFKAVTVTVYGALDPRVTERLEGEAVMEKSGGADEVTTSVTIAAWVRVPLVPVTVSV